MCPRRSAADADLAVRHVEGGELDGREPPGDDVQIVAFDRADRDHEVVSLPCEVRHRRPYEPPGFGATTFPWTLSSRVARNNPRYAPCWYGSIARPTSGSS